MNHFKVGTFLLGLLLLASCTITRAMWDRNYEETFRQFLISRDSKYVVFIGNEYHYIFDDNSTVMSELLESEKPNIFYINTQKTYIKVDSNNNLSGYAIIESFSENLSKVDEAFLVSLGFRSGGPQLPLMLKVKLKGKRYIPESDFVHPMPRMERSYIVQIHESSGFFGSIAKAAVTPITMTADSVLMIGKVLLYPFSSS